jgi:uncharacterized protein DUF5985
MATIVYLLCALTALICTFMLIRGYLNSGYRLLLWSGICFAGLTLNNVVLVIDKLLIVSVDLSVWRTLLALAAMAILLYGLIWDAE